MNTEHEPKSTADDPGHPVQQQQQRPQREGHGGRGADSALKQMRRWEQDRARNAGKGREGPA